MGKKEGIIFTFILLVLIVVILATGSFNEIKKTITGQAVDQLDINITIGTPTIIAVYNATMTDVSGGLSSGPLKTSVLINFSVNSPTGVANINSSTASINFTQSGEDTRENTSCKVTEWAGTNANFTCNVTMWYWDATGTWTIGAYIEDNSSNANSNISADFQIGETTGFELSPGNLTWSSLSPGAYNQTASNNPLLLNNTGNKAIGAGAGNITVNATNLRGETTATQALWAENFSVAWNTEGSPPAECITNLSAGNFANVTTANLTKGNYSTNDGDTGQEELYFCIRYVGSELSSQAYSTANESTWTIQI